MNKTILLLIATVLVFSIVPMVNAGTNYAQNLVVYLPLNESAGATQYFSKSDGNIYTGNALSTVTGKNGNGVNSSDTTDDYIIINNTACGVDVNDDWSMSFWVNTKYVSDTLSFGMLKSTGVYGTGVMYMDQDTGFYWKGDAGVAKTCGNYTLWEDGKWHNIVVSWNPGVSQKMYIDGQEMGMGCELSGLSGNINKNGNRNNIYIGTLENGYVSADGIAGFDEFAFWDRPLNSTEIIGLYNGGTGCFWGNACWGSGAVTPTGDYLITAYDYATNSSLNEFNAALFNGTNTVFTNTINGTIKYNKENFYYNITVFTNWSYWNSTYLNRLVNSSNTLISYLTPWPNVTVYDQGNNSRLTHFSYVIDGVKYYSGNNWFVVVPFNESNKFVKINRSNYIDNNITLNFTYPWGTVSTFPVNNSLHQAEIKIYGYEVITGNKINIFNSSFNETVGHTNGAYFIWLNVSSGSALLKMDSKNYTNQSMLISVSPLDYLTYNWSVWQTQLVIKDVYPNGTEILDFSAIGNALNYTWLNYSNATVGNLTYRLLFGSYNFSVDTPTTSSSSVILWLNDTFESYSFTAYTMNSINFTFYDEETLEAIVTYNLTLEFVGSYMSANYSTTTGKIWTELITPDTYTLRYVGLPYYPQRFKFFTLVNDTTNSLILYLLNGTTASYANVIPTVYDEGSFPLENAKIVVQKYNILTNSYFTVEECLTNFEGECPAGLHLEEVTEFYKFLIYYCPTLDTCELKKQTTPTYIKSGTASLSFQISTQDSPTEYYYHAGSVDYQLSFIETPPQYFRFFWADKDGTATQGCMYIYMENMLGSTLINSSCVAGSTGIIMLGASNVDNTTYRALTTVWWGTAEEFIDSLSYTYADVSDFGNMGIFFTIILVIVLACVAIWSPVVASILAPFGLIISRVAGFINISWGYIIPIQIIGFVIAFIISRRS